MVKKLGLRIGGDLLKAAILTHLHRVNYIHVTC